MTQLTLYTLIWFSDVDICTFSLMAGNDHTYIAVSFSLFGAFLVFFQVPLNAHIVSILPEEFNIWGKGVLPPSPPPPSPNAQCYSDWGADCLRYEPWVPGWSEQTLHHLHCHIQEKCKFWCLDQQPPLRSIERTKTWSNLFFDVQINA